MLTEVLILVFSLVMILISCEFFTNSVEWLGIRLRIGDGIVGSLFSAVGTCLPETSIPLIAILFSKNAQKASDISIGAIIGAPFMLGTLAFFITGVSALLFGRIRPSHYTIQADMNMLYRDLGFFIFAYSVGIIAAFLPLGIFRFLSAVVLIVCYGVYILLTVRQDTFQQRGTKRLYIREMHLFKKSRVAFPVQITLALTGIFMGADLFVDVTGRLSQSLGVSALVLSLVIAPIATELPEKFNSILWVKRGRDTLALGNITGAMVFQSCIPISIGIVATSWRLDSYAFSCAGLALLSVLLVLFRTKYKGKLDAVTLLLGGILYGVFILLLVW